MEPPVSAPAGEKRSDSSLPNREELWLRVVFALPKASSRTLEADSSACSASPTRAEPPRPAAPAEAEMKKERMILADSVLPAPDSPLITTDCDRPRVVMS
eukprot:scaffold39323_cov180-Isochrysis_galbana.AAC.1